MLSTRSDGVEPVRILGVDDCAGHADLRVQFRGYSVGIARAVGQEEL